MSEAFWDMYRRDTFAAAALTGLLANSSIRSEGRALEECRNDYAEIAYKFADAMLTARDATPAPSATEGGDSK